MPIESMQIAKASVDISIANGGLSLIFIILTWNPDTRAHSRFDVLNLLQIIQ